ncbi:MAG: GTP cyclohydrolase II [Deltaproteobacteria bacterium]|nr:GTP cyclohydrolase II [Deltaproteobacteria bacterium]
MQKRIDPTLSHKHRKRSVQLVAEATLPSRFGDFRIAAFEATGDEDHAAVIKGDIAGKTGVPVRLHSECFTGDVMGSLRCDCRDQLEAALVYVGEQEYGAVLYLHQEGRGIGLANKIRAYALQDDGMDTVEANLALGFHDDERDYEVAAMMLKALGVVSVKLLTNNPSKIKGLEHYGIQVEERVPLAIAPNVHNVDYLRTKKLKSGHLL